VTTSGAPMQSAARVPILISFEVEDYEGPDNDPVLVTGGSRVPEKVKEVSLPLAKPAPLGRQASVSSVHFKKYLKKKSSARKSFRQDEEGKNNDDSQGHSG
jgi:hypothetical protein